MLPTGGVLGPQPRNLPWLGIKQVTFRFAGWCSIHWAGVISVILSPWGLCKGLRSITKRKESHLPQLLPYWIILVCDWGRLMPLQFAVEVTRQTHGPAQEERHAGAQWTMAEGTSVRPSVGTAGTSWRPFPCGNLSDFCAICVSYELVLCQWEPGECRSVLPINKGVIQLASKTFCINRSVFTYNLCSYYVFCAVVCVSVRTPEWSSCSSLTQLIPILVPTETHAGPHASCQNSGSDHTQS